MMPASLSGVALTIIMKRIFGLLVSTDVAPIGVSSSCCIDTTSERAGNRQTGGNFLRGR
jgi:hypothetical protein